MMIVAPVLGKLPSLDELRSLYHLKDMPEDRTEMAAEFFAKFFSEKDMGWLESAMLIERLHPFLRQKILIELELRWATEKYDLSPEIKSKAEDLIWGSYGLSGKEPLRLLRLIDLESDHIRNILTFCMAPQMTRLVLLRLLRQRCERKNDENGS